MTVEEAKQAKIDLAIKIAMEIRLFQDNTGLVCYGIELSYHEMMIHNPTLTNIKLDVKLW